MEKMESLPKLFYFVKADEYGSCNVLIKVKPVNLGNGDGMQVSCTLNFAEDIEVLENKLYISK